MGFAFKGKILLTNIYSNLGDLFESWSVKECFSNTRFLLQEGKSGQERTTNSIIVLVATICAVDLSRHHSGISLRDIVIIIDGNSLSSLI